MSEISLNSNLETTNTAPSLVIFLEDKISRGDPIGKFQAHIEKAYSCSIIYKKNLICMMNFSKFDSTTDEQINKEQSISIKSDFYVDLEITVKPNYKYEDKFNILKPFTNETLFVKPKEEKNQFKIIDHVKLVPSINYPFPSRVIPIFGKIDKKKINKKTFYKISCEKLNIKTIAEKNGEFVLFIDDEVVNPSTILNTEKTEYQIEMKIDALTFENNNLIQETFNEKFEISFPKDLSTYNIGSIERTSN